MTKRISMALFLGLIGLTGLSFAQNKSTGGGTPAGERLRSWAEHVRMRDESAFRGLHWQSLGPRFSGGRVETIDAVPGTGIIYVGFGAGHVWKTVNNGLTWTPVFEREAAATIGDLEIADSRPETVWVGTGENLMARSSLAGLGVYRSDDGGRTWRNMGLQETHHIGRVVIHPDNPDIVYVAALGHEYTANDERGLFKTVDGGLTWIKCLFISDRAGVVDVTMDPSDPETLYAASYEHTRKAWKNTSTGPGCGIHKTTDGGRTWTRLAGGLPQGPNIGRIGLAAAPSTPGVVYALLVNRTPEKVKTDKGEKSESPGPEVYRSADGGTTWTKKAMRNDRFKVHSYGDIRVSPVDSDEIYVLGVNLLHSRDGGETFEQLEGRIVHLYDHPTRALHLDQHELWIDPDDPDRLILGNDGGVYITNDRGLNWLHANNIPAGEFYALSVDNADPYFIYGGTQDNAAVFGPADRYPEDGIEDPWSYVWIDLWGGGDSYVTRVDPGDPDTIYFEQQFGGFQRKDMQTGEIKRIRPALDDKDRLRFNWMSPFLISHHNRFILYFGANRLFKSLNRGDDWICISPDLTTDPGPDRRGNVPYGTITTISESALRPGRLYVGTDDGRVWTTGNDGADWTEITAGLPDKWVSRVEASSSDPETVYVSLTGYREDDFATYLYRSDDTGGTWMSLSPGLPSEPFNVIREDPGHAGLLYAGSDQGGVYVSRDRGATWSSLCADLPTAAVHDIAVQSRARELVIATHGRGVFKLDLIPVQEFGPKIPDQPLHLFPIRPARLPQSRDYRGDWAFETRRPAVFHYSLGSEQDVSITIREKDGTTVKTWDADGRAGLNRAVWDLSHHEQPANQSVYEAPFRLVQPGLYQVEIRAGAETRRGELRIAAPEQNKIGASRKGF